MCIFFFFVAFFPIGPCRVYSSLEQDVYDIPSSRSEGRQRHVRLTSLLVSHDKAMIPTCVLKVQVKLPPQIMLDADLLAPPEMDSGILAFPMLDSGFLAPLVSFRALLGAPGLSWELLGSPVSFSAFLITPLLSWELLSATADAQIRRILLASLRSS